jgi:hypothetical protein
MSTQGRSCDNLVTEFVGYLNSAGFEPKFPDDVAEELRTSEAGVAEACGSRTHHPGREGQDQWL